MHVELFHRIEDIPLNNIEWDSLVRENITNTIFQTYEWFHIWWRNYGNDNELMFLVLKDSFQSIVAFAPLMSCHDNFGRKSLRFVGDNNADYCDFVIKGDRAQAIRKFLSYLFTNKVEWSSMILLNIPEHSTSKVCLEQICKDEGYKIQIKSPVPAPSLVLKGNESEIRASLSRYSINRHLSKLKNLGSLDFKHLYEYEDIVPLIEDFFEQHVRRYGIKQSCSQFTIEINRQYFRELLASLCKSRSIIFSVLTLNNKNIAYHFGFQYDNKILWYKPTFNIDYKEHSPGTILLKYLILYGIDESLDELDFGIGGEVYKDRFCNSLRNNENVAIYRHSLLHNIHLMRQFAGRIYNIIKKLIIK